jgi:hypothetical protein
LTAGLAILLALVGEAAVRPTWCKLDLIELDRLAFQVYRRSVSLAQSVAPARVMRSIASGHVIFPANYCDKIAGVARSFRGNERIRVGRQKQCSLDLFLTGKDNIFFSQTDNPTEKRQLAYELHFIGLSGESFSENPTSGNSKPTKSKSTPGVLPTLLTV